MMWSFDDVVHEENLISQYEYKEHRENNVNIKDEDNETYVFHVKDLDDYIHYANGYIQLKVKITTVEGGSIEQQNVSFVNTGNFFERAALIMGNSLIEEVNDPCLAQHINGLVNFSEDYANGSEATNMMFFKDTSAKPNRALLYYNSEEATPVDTIVNTRKFLKLITANKDYNEGFVKRFSLTKKSNSVNLLIPLRQYFGLFNHYQKLFTGIDVKVELKRGSSRNMLLTDTDLQFKVSFNDISLLLPHVQLKSEANIVYNKRVIPNDIELQWSAMNLLRSNIQRNSNGRYIVNTCSNDISDIYVIPMYNEKLNNMKANNMTFDNLNLKQTYVTINNTRFPYDFYTVDFSKEHQNYARYYSNFLAAGKKDTCTEVGSLVSHKEFASLYPIIHFNVSNHPDYASTSTLNVEFAWETHSPPDKDFIFYFLIVEKRKGVLNMEKKRFTVLSSL